MNIAYLEFCQGDPYFYDTPRALVDEPFEVPPVPVGWESTPGDGWCHVAPIGVRLPVQGWKIHLSSVPDQASTMLSTAAKVCFDQGLAFKFNSTRHDLIARNAKYADRGGSGKFITVYPADESELESAVYALDAATAGMPGPYILSDLRWSAGPVHVRYGGFRPMFTEGADGVSVPAVLRPDGTPVPDPREPQLVVPDWVSVPAFLTAELERYLADDVDLPFEITEAIHFSNGGGVYLGSVPGRADKVVIKEGRRHAGLDGLLRSGFERVAHEARIMDLLDGIDGIPHVVDVVDVWEHRFVAMSRVDGHSLTMDVSLNNPLSSHAPDAHEVAAYVDRATAIIRQVRAIVTAAHERGVSIGDIQPQNVLVTEHPRVSLIDFEAARTSDTARALGTPGFMTVHEKDRFLEDLFAVHRLALFLFLPMNDVLSLAPGLADAHIAFVEELFGAEAARTVRELRDASREPSHTGHDGFHAAAPGFLLTAGGRSELARGVVATTGRFTGRLFPGDIAQFEGDGAHDLWSGSAGVVLALHRTGHLDEGTADAFLASLPETRRLMTDSLMTGSVGVITVLEEIGRHDLARAWLDQVLRAGVRVPADNGLRSGTAGMLVGLLSLSEGGPVVHRTCHDLADALVGRIEARTADDTDATTKPGLFQGWSGAAVAMLLAADLLDRPDLIEPARRAVHLDLDRCITFGRDDSLQVDDDGRALPYLAHGSVGIGLAAQAVLGRTDDPELAAAVPRLVRPALSAAYLCGGLTQGRGGMIAALGLVDAEHLPRPRADLVREHVERLDLYTPVRDEGMFLAGDQNLRFSTDYATGSAGLLLALEPSTDQVAWLPGQIPTRLFTARQEPARAHPDSHGRR